MDLPQLSLDGPEPGWLEAATELGDRARYDLRVFDRDRCELLADVWRRVPIVWADGAPVARPPPARCVSRRGAP